MGDIVVDSSFAIAFMVEEDHSSFARDLVGAFDRAVFRAPVLICWEVTNALQMKVRRGMLSLEERAGHLSTFDLLDIDLEPTPDQAVLARTTLICDRTGLTGYDAAYLELALDLGAELATIDRRLAAAARAEGLAVHAPF